MVLLMYIITFLFPLISLPINFIMLLINKNKKIHYMIQNSFSLATFSFCWHPTATYDLYGWHLTCLRLSKMNLIQFKEFLLSNGEPLNNLLKYLAGISGNVNYLQFIVVFIGFIIINALINKIIKKIDISQLEFAVIYILTFTSLLFVNFISGLFFYFASIILCYGIYLIYDNKKKSGLFLLFISFLIHSSMFFPIAMYLMYYFLCGSKINFRSIIMSIIVALSIGYILPLFIGMIKIPLFNEFADMYNGYFQQTTFNSMNSRYFLLFNIIELFPIVILSILHNKKLENFSGFSIVMGISAVIIALKVPIFIRYVFLSSLSFVPYYCDFFKNSKDNLKFNNSKIVTIVLLIVIGLASIYQFKLLNDINFSNIYYDNFYKIIFIIFGK